MEKVDLLLRAVDAYLLCSSITIGYLLIICLALTFKLRKLEKEESVK